MTYAVPATHPVYLDGVLLNTQNWITGTNGVRITAIEGWTDSPDVRDSRRARSGRHGEYPDSARYAGRDITIHGEVSGSTWADLQANKLALNAKVQLTTDEVVLKLPEPQVTSPSWTHSASMTDFERASVRVVDGVEYDDTDAPLLESFTIQLRASDPRIYSDVEVTTTSTSTGTATRTISWTQAGSTPTESATIRVDGPATAPWQVSAPQPSGTALLLPVVSRSLVTGEYMTFEPRTRTCTLVTDYITPRIADSDTVGLWMLEETAGTTATDSDGTQNGTYNGGYTLNQTGFDTGSVAVQLNGSTGYVSIAYNATQQFTNNLTFECWVKFSSVAGTQTIYDCITSNLGWRFELTSSTNLRFTVGTGATTTNHDFTLGSALSTGVWYHIVLSTTTKTIGSSSLWVNGTQYTAGPCTTYSKNTSGGARIGSRLAGSNWLNGYITAVLIANGSVSSGGVDVPLTCTSRGAGNSVSGYQFLDANTLDWGNPAGLEDGAQSISYSAATLATGAQLQAVTREARV